MAVGIATIRTFRTEKCLKVTDKAGATYLLRPQRQVYFDIVEMAAEKQRSFPNNKVDSSEALLLIDEILCKRKRMKLHERRVQDCI